MRLHVVYPRYCSGRHVSHTCLSLCDHMAGDGLDLTLWVPASEGNGRRPYIRDAVPGPLRKLAFRLDPSAEIVNKYMFNKAAKTCGAGDLVWIWPGTDISLVTRAQAKGATVLWEQIGCNPGSVNRIMAEVYERAGWRDMALRFEQDGVDRELEIIQAVDYIFCPSPGVKETLLENGIAETKLIETTYGWDPDRINPKSTETPAEFRGNGIKVLFVGRLRAGKGIHLLLDIWDRAGIEGQLVFVGRMGDEIAEHCREALKRPTVAHVPFTENVASYYQAAEVFVLLTFHEGSPLVVYEAMGAGVPIVTTPMGAGNVVRDNVEGFILDPYDTEGWMATLQRLAGDPALRNRLGEAGRARAAEFTWDKVGARRREALLTRFS